MRHWLGAALCGAALLIGGTAFAQNLALRAPQWAQALLSADVTPTTGGRSLILAEGIPVAVRVTIAPSRGGIARVIRYDQTADSASLYVRRFTGHPSTGWWLWGGDSPRVDAIAAAQRTEIANLVRSAAGVAGQVGGSNEVCANGEQAFVEISFEGRASSLGRACVANTDAAGRLILRLSELAGSRTEEELAAAATDELMAVDRAFNAKAQADGVPAAFEHYAAEDAIIVTSGEIASGRAGIAHTYTGWPTGARLSWAPETARVSARGDMGWTWGNSVMTLPDGTRTNGRYVAIWTRDYEGNWKYAFDAPIR